MTSTVVKTENVHITPLDAPFLPFHLGQAKLIQNKHTFIHFLEIKYLNSLLDRIKSFYDTIINRIGKNNPQRKDNLTYRHITDHLLSITLHVIATADAKLNNIRPQSSTKRGLLNIVGKTSKYLFGTLDSDDGRIYDDAIDILMKNQNSIKYDSDVQMSLMQEMINNYNKTITILSNNQNLIEAHLATLETDLGRMFDEINDFIQIQDVLTQIISNCRNLITFLDNVETAITFAKLNTVHSAILSKENIESMIFKL